jgi:hypothetical protein
MEYVLLFMMGMVAVGGVVNVINSGTRGVRDAFLIIMFSLTPVLLICVAGYIEQFGLEFKPNDIINNLKEIYK